MDIYIDELPEVAGLLEARTEDIYLRMPAYLLYNRLDMYVVCIIIITSCVHRLYIGTSLCQLCV